MPFRRISHYEILEPLGKGGMGVVYKARDSRHAVLLDVMLPGKNGLDVCRELRQRDFLAPILMLTGKGNEIDRVVGLEVGADDYVVKPFSRRELLARIRAHLRRESSLAGVRFVGPA